MGTCSALIVMFRIGAAFESDPFGFPFPVPPPIHAEAKGLWEVSLISLRAGLALGKQELFGA